VMLVVRVVGNAMYTGAALEGVEFLCMENRAAVDAVGSGTYRFESTLP
jgi:hypothetical protein